MIPSWAGLALFVVGVIVGYFIRILQEEDERWR